MGGQSFECRLCGRWVLDIRALRQHLADKHKLDEIKIEEIVRNDQ